MESFEELFRRTGDRLREVLRLFPRSEAKSVRVREGRLVVADGPFAETKEQIGGVLVVDCDNLDAAIEIARDVPVAGIGTVEVRPMAPA